MNGRTGYTLKRGTTRQSCRAVSCTHGRLDFTMISPSISIRILLFARYAGGLSVIAKSTGGGEAVHLFLGSAFDILAAGSRTQQRLPCVCERACSAPKGRGIDRESVV